MSILQKTRIDKWLWAVRMFKTRTLATDCCSSGKVKINNDSIKASHQIKIGDTVVFKKENETKILKVVAILEKRVGASIAQSCYEDLSPVEEKINNMPKAFYDFEKRDRGIGRPTKLDRRNIEEFKNQDLT